MRFRCCSYRKEWIVPKEKLVYISDWPDACPDCGSAKIYHETVEKVIGSSAVPHNIHNNEVEEIERRKLEKTQQGFKTGGGVTR